MQLINPIWLWGLTGLLIPIGIHLLSRKEGKIIKFGSLRHLEESHTKQSINVRLNEVGLLLMRCSLIVLIVMLLCGLKINPLQSQKSEWIILEQGLEQDPGVVPLIDSLKENGFEAKSMTKGFPDIQAQQTEPFANYWEMIYQLPIESLNNVIIVSYNLSSKFRGKRIALPKNVTWISREPEQSEFTLSRIKFSNDSVMVRAGKSSSLQTSFTNSIESNKSHGTGTEIRLETPDTISIAIYADNDFEYDRKIIMASLHAIERTIPVVLEIATSAPAPLNQDPKPDWIIWLSKSTPDEGISTTNSLVLQEDAGGSTRLLTHVKSKGDNQAWLITKRLNEETALKEQLTLNLTSLLLKYDLAEARADSLNQTTQPEELLWSQATRNTSVASVGVDDDETGQFLLAAIIILLMAERFVAFKRNA
jgi:hypothetical protein